MIEVKLPGSQKDLRIKHFKSMANMPENGFRSEQENLVFLAEFLGLTYNQILDFTRKDVHRMTALAMKALSKMDLVSKLPATITLKGQKFCLVDPEMIGIGWQIDFKGASIFKDPVRLACLFYLQEGFNYSSVDENGNITYPIASRQELFEQEFPLDLFIRCANFFLKQSLVSTRKSMVIKIQMSKAKNRTSLVLQAINPFNGKSQLRQ